MTYHRALDSSHVPTQRFSLEAQGRLVKYRAHYQAKSKNPGGGLRGAITEFSAQSRKRLLEKMARLQVRDVAKFITLTYGQAWPSAQQAKAHLRAFLERIRRRWPKASAIWRIEYQKRGAPHFHLIVFGLPFWPKSEVARHWSEVIGDDYLDYSADLDAPRAPFTRIEALAGHKHAMQYMSKYVAKVPDEDSAAASAPGFNTSAYLHEGRWWGVFNAAFLPYAPTVWVLNAEDWSAHNEIRLVAQQIWSGISTTNPLKGFTLFTDNAYDIAAVARYLFDRAQTYLFGGQDENLDAQRFLNAPATHAPIAIP